MKLRILGPLQSQLDLIPEPLWASAISSNFKFSALSFFFFSSAIGPTPTTPKCGLCVLTSNSHKKEDLIGY